MQKLFLCHFTQEDPEVSALAEEMHLRGIPLWLDHEGGFLAGDNVQTEARRVIASPEETFGLLLYATPETFERVFIQRIELREALRRKDADADYLLIAVPRRMSFADMSRLSRERLGEDLTLFHAQAIHDRDGEGIRALPLRPQFAEVANMILRQRLTRFIQTSGAEALLGINFCTRDHLPASADDLLDLDATRLFAPGMPVAQAWPRLREALLDVKRQMRQIAAVPRLRIRGSKHLTAAFLIGRVFPPPAVREIATQQGSELWSTACAPKSEQPFTVNVVDGSAESEALYVEITATDKSVREGVRQYIALTRTMPFAFLRLEPVGGPRHGAVESNAVACAMALQVRSEISRLVAERGIKEIHLFASIPQGLATLIGHHLNATVPIYLYEYDGQAYKPSMVLDHRDL